MRVKRNIIIGGIGISLITLVIVTAVWLQTTKDNVASVIISTNRNQSDWEKQQEKSRSHAGRSLKNRRKQFNAILAANAERTHLVELEGGDFSHKQDVEFDKIANVRGKHLVEGFEKLEAMINQGKNLALTKRVKSLVESVIEEEAKDTIVLGNVDCVDTFCRVQFEGDTLNATGEFLDALKAYADLDIAESEFSPHIKLDEESGTPEDPGDSPTENNVYFAMGSNHLPVNPTDFSNLNIQ